MPEPNEPGYGGTIVSQPAPLPNEPGYGGTAPAQSSPTPVVIATDQEILPDWTPQMFVDAGVGGTTDLSTAREIADTEMVPVATPQGEIQLSLKQWVAMTPVERLMVKGIVPIQNQAMAIKLQYAGLEPLDTGEAVQKYDFSKMPQDEQQILKTQGITGWQEKYTVQLAYIDPKTGNPQRVSRNFYDSLDETDKQRLNESGLESVQGGGELLSAETKANYVQLDNGEIVDRAFFESDSLTDEQRQFLKVKGIEAFNKEYQGQYRTALEGYVANAGGSLEALRILIAENGLESPAVTEYISNLQATQEMDVTEIQEQPNFNKLSQSAQIFLLNSNVGDYYKAETPEAKFQWLLDNKVIPRGSTYAGEVDENGNPMIFPPTTEAELALAREDAINGVLPEGYKNWLNTPLALFNSKVTYGELAQSKLFNEYGSPSAQEKVVLMPEAGGRDWNIEAVNRAFQYIPFEKKVFFDVPEAIQAKMTAENIKAGIGTVGWDKLIDIKATWANLTENEKALVLLSYSPTPSGLEQAIDAARIPILYEVKNWDSLSTTEKIFGVVNDILLVAPLISPFTRPLSALASRAMMATSIGERATNIVSNIGRDISLAMKSGDATRLAGA